MKRETGLSQGRKALVRAAVERRKASGPHPDPPPRAGEGQGGGRAVNPPSGNAAIARSGLSVRAFRRSASPYVFGGSVSCRAAKLGRKGRAARTGAHAFRPRTQCGGGGPCEAWWRGLLTRRFVVVEGGSSRPAPSPPHCCAARSPLPHLRGGGGDAAAASFCHDGVLLAI